MYRPSWYIEEEKEMVNAYFNDKSYKKTLYDYIDEHASEKWKKYRDKMDSIEEKYLKKGIIIDQIKLSWGLK